MSKSNGSESCRSLSSSALGAALTAAAHANGASAAKAPAAAVRTFWCSRVERDVEVQYTTRGVPGFRTESIITCSAFEPASAITCARSCTDAAFRRIWAPLPPPFLLEGGTEDRRRS